jgi:hypothetical protein
VRDVWRLCVAAAPEVCVCVRLWWDCCFFSEGRIATMMDPGVTTHPATTYQNSPSTITLHPLATKSSAMCFQRGAHVASPWISITFLPASFPHS